MARPETRNVVVAAIPAAVPVTMAAVFAMLRRSVSARTAYNVGFAVYWLGWCWGFPLWVLGPRNTARMLTAGRHLAPRYVVLLAIPVAGAVGTELVPRRRQVDVPTAAVMATAAVVNAAGEELLWRGVFLHVFGRHPLALAWSLLGFSLWHFAPQIVLPSPLGRRRFVAGSSVVGAAWTLGAYKSGGLRQVVVAHAITDACGVTASRFRLGR